MLDVGAKEGNRRAEGKMSVAGCVSAGCIVGGNLVGRGGKMCWT